jgi:hypothetical protein
MRRRTMTRIKTHFASRAAGALVLALVGWTGITHAQTGSAKGMEPADKVVVADKRVPTADSVMPTGDIQQVGCSTCGSGLMGGSGGAAYGGGGCGSGDCAAGCYPGRKPCDCSGIFGDTAFGRAVGGLYECICCPDPCYEPQYVPAADAAFFVDGARPVTQMRLRVDAAWELKNPDRAEFFWPRDRTNPQQVGPAGPCARTGSIGKGPGFIASSVNYQDISLYSEAAAGNFGMFVEMPYRHIDPETGAISSQAACPASGFADMNLGTKALLLDCDLLQLTFQFKTFLPTGDFLKGLGTAHVSLEPSFLWAVKLTPDSYVQGQLSYWIPIAGDDLYQADIFHTHMSYNHVLWRPCCGIQLVGTLEVNEWSVMGGAYTVPDFLIAGKPVAASGTATMLSAGPGARLYICDKIDIGVGSAFSITGPRWAEDLVRAEFRWRF